MQTETVSRDVEWSHLSANQLNAVAENPKVIVLLPVAAIEQHGPHLPTLTDTQLGMDLCIAAAKAMGEQTPTLVLPPMWAGMSDHHVPYGGTISLTFEEFSGVLNGITRSVRRAGFKRLAMVNTHGGNSDALAVMAVELARGHDISVVTVTPWELARVGIAELLTTQGGVMHACEAETSMMMHLRPELVRSGELADFDPVFPNRPPQGLKRFASFKELAGPKGVLGDPRAATPELGSKILSLASETLALSLQQDTVWG